MILLRTTGLTDTVGESGLRRVEVRGVGTRDNRRDDRKYNRKEGWKHEEPQPLDRNYKRKGVHWVVSWTCVVN